ncbi:MAG: DUF2244 domain-containing protein [Methylobacillus sp.]|nr:DUF2244 domain-containing protein [Methylobacillus sp.]
MATSVIDYKVVARPNHSMSRKETFRVVAVLALFSLSVATAFGLLGAWLVFPFAGLELLALAYAFHFVLKHADDYESITISGDRLAIEKQHHKSMSQIVLNRYWAQVVLKEAPGGEHRLWLRSHGKEFEVGKFMSDRQRLVVASQLKMRTGAVYQGAI